MELVAGPNCHPAAAGLRFQRCVQFLAVVDAPPSAVWDELHGVTMSALPVGRAFEAVRLLLPGLSGRKHRPLAARSFLDVTPIPVGLDTLLSTETRVLATDPRTRRTFATYWFLIRPSSAAIGREVLRTVAHRAESQFA